MTMRVDLRRLRAMVTMSLAATRELMPALEKLAPVIPGRMSDIGVIYDACLADLFGYATSLTRDRTAAEDVVQEAFVRLVAEDAAGRRPENRERGSTGSRRTWPSAARAGEPSPTAGSSSPVARPEPTRPRPPT